MLTAVEKIRQQLTGDPHGEPHFQHEGPGVVRWITGGPAPSIHAVFLHRDDDIVASCPQCGQVFGRFGAHYGGATFRQVAAIREVGNAHQCQ